MNGATETQISEIHGMCKELRDVQVEHGKTLATLEERTDNQKDRMDRIDRKVAKRGSGFGAGAGAAAGAFTATLLQWLGLGSGGS